MKLRHQSLGFHQFQGEGTHALAEGDSLQRLVMWAKDKDVF